MPDAHLHPELLNRELSWLAFNERVLHEALDERTPLLERAKFLGIVSANLDEFYKVRVAGLRRQVATGAMEPSPDGLPPDVQLSLVQARARALAARQYRGFAELLPALSDHGIQLLGADELTPADWAFVDQIFEAQLYPVLTPFTVGPGRPFPYISNLSLSLAVLLSHPEGGAECFARVKVPKSIARWVPVGRPNCFVAAEQVIGANLEVLFPGIQVRGWYPFRITRYADLDLSGAAEPEDLLQVVEERVFQRRLGEVVRLEVQADMPAELRLMLLAELQAEVEDAHIPRPTEADVHEVHGLLDLSDLVSLATLNLPAPRDVHFAPVTAPQLRDGRSMFEVIAAGDLLVHHPYESFATSVERFFEEAAVDEQVLAIRSTLYRTSGDTAIVRALAEAARRGKRVTVLVELTARFDEVNNIGWTRTLEEHGIRVVHGPPQLKTHAKIALVVRREGEVLRRYVHIGTGNYNSKTALLYTDLGLFTDDPDTGADVQDLFDRLTGSTRDQHFRKLLVAPQNMRGRFLALVDREAARARAGGPGRARIAAKMNALVDPEMIRALYRASRAGVEIDLVVRGTCCLRPGVPGLSDRIRVRSIIGRFLEHSRIYCFGDGERTDYLIGSADWMPRNLDRRVEVVVPVEHPPLRNRLRAILAICLNDNRQAWELGPDGAWTQRRPGGAAPHGTHAELLRDPIVQYAPATGLAASAPGIPTTSRPDAR